MPEVQGTNLPDPFDAAPDPALVVDHRWCLARVNAAARDLFGLGNDDLGADFWQAVPDAAHPARAPQYRRAMGGAGTPAFDQPVAANGRCYAVRCRSLPPAPGGGLLITLTDAAVLRRAVIDPTDGDLADREQRYRMMFERSPVPILVYVTDDRRITMANDAAVAQYGYARADLVGRPVTDLLNPEDVDRLSATIAELVPGQEVRALNVHHRRRDGSAFPVEVTSHGFTVAGRHVRAVVAVDTTDRDRAERDLRDSERRYRSLVDTADGIVIALDDAARITEWNGAAEQVSGYARAEVMGWNYLDRFVPPEARPAAEAEAARVADGRPTRGFEGLMLTRSGQRRTLLWNAHRQLGPDGTAIGMVAVGQDITDRKRAEDLLRASENLHRTLGNALPQLMWTLTPSGTFEYANARFNDFTGLTSPDLAHYSLGEDGSDGAWAAFVHPDDVAALVRQLRADRDAAAPGQVEVRWCGGQQCTEAGYWFLVRHAPLLDREGRVVRWVGTATDVDALKRAEAALTRTAAEADAARRAAEHANEAKDRFLAVLSHELRTPLTPVLLTASALQCDPALSADVREAVDMIVEQVELESRLIDDLLDLTRIARGKFLLTPQPVDGHDLVRRAIEVCRRTLDEAGVAFTADLSVAADAAGRQLSADPVRIHQVLCNLLNNAAKFTPVGGRVRLATASVGAGEHRSFTVAVTDTGVGIAAEALPRIFNAFEQGERSITRRFGGLGLGLTIGRAIADLHGGSLSADSAGPGQGATLILSLPVSADPTPAPSSPAPAARSARRLRVLLVDDHAPTLKMMARLVESLGHDVRTAGSSEAALALATADVPDLLVSDIGLPSENGWSLVSAVRARCVPPPVAVAVSGYGTDADLARSRAAGFARHLTKPIALADLRRAIDELVP